MAAEWKKIALLVRMLGTDNECERRVAYVKLISFMRSSGITWTDIGDRIEQFAGEGKYTEAELHEFNEAFRTECVERGIKISEARRNGRGGSGCFSLPEPSAMAEFCHDRLGRLKDDKQREFIVDMVMITQRGRELSLGRLGYLASIYIQIGGRT